VIFSARVEYKRTNTEGKTCTYIFSDLHRKTLYNGVTTGIGNGQRESVKGQRDGWFTIDGKKLSGKPTKKGVYIHNGRKAVVR
jgi:hypothetical protein